jgi:hypothetical protein
MTKGSPTRPEQDMSRSRGFALKYFLTLAETVSIDDCECVFGGIEGDDIGGARSV